MGLDASERRGPRPNLPEASPSVDRFAKGGWWPYLVAQPRSSHELDVIGGRAIELARAGEAKRAVRSPVAVERRDLEPVRLWRERDLVGLDRGRHGAPIGGFSGDDPDRGSYLRIEERGLEAGGADLAPK